MKKGMGGFLSRGISALMFSWLLYSDSGFADTIYGELKKDKKQAVAYIDWERVEEESRLYSKLEKLEKKLGRNDPLYRAIALKIDQNIKKASYLVAEEMDYDVVVEEEDVEGLQRSDCKRIEDITSAVIHELREIEEGHEER